MTVVEQGMAGAPSDWLMRWAQAWRERPGATALDLACGSGRHLALLAEAGLRVTGVDRDAQALATAAARAPAAELIAADIEQGPWPLAARRFDLVLVTHYLWRPLLPRIVDAVAPGGWLIYETFAHGQQSVGRPSRPDFLLQPGELLRACEGLRIVAYEDGFLGAGHGGGVNERFVQRVAAVRAEAPEPGGFARYHLG
ncbi:class I SAM-dependent methyltransferase [Pelomonas sp. CA6]|uniref:class I SAM-dependent methyltransferase n=1 Tax=Pelomonas sp. CA6 TaxID=2907999 RepID=UPI0035A85E85